MIDALISEAAGAVGAGRLGAAARLLRQMLAVDPAHIAGANSLAAVFILDDALDAAEVLLARAVAILPEEPALWINRSVQALRMGDMARARRWSRTNLVMTPGSREGHLYLGRAIDRSEPEAACTAFHRVLHLDPYTADAHFGLSKVLLDGDDLSGAARHGRAMLTLQPGSPAAEANLAVAAWGLGWRGAARRSAQHALCIDRTLAQARWILALALLAEGDCAAGLPLLESRWDLAEFRAVDGRDFSAPAWDGTIRPGMRL
ncbi:MAG: hypothetical protein HYR63_23470, partial [Proteobacteria bacterium]|nr:hypothetical protein [Pseudomonadota bacterium]